MLICICTDVSAAHRGSGGAVGWGPKLKDEAQVSRVPLNEMTRGHTQDMTQRKVPHYKERCLLKQIKERPCLKRFDKQNKFNLDTASESISFENRILRSRQAGESHFMGRKKNLLMVITICSPL